MSQRFVYLWFAQLEADWWARRQPALQGQPLVLQAAQGGHLKVVACNALALAQGIVAGMKLADAKALAPGLHCLPHQPGLAARLLRRLAGWCIRFSPSCQPCPSHEGIVLDASGCAHLWGGEEGYLAALLRRLRGHGYAVQAAVADTLGAAWAMARHGSGASLVPPGGQHDCLRSLPAAALRLEPAVLDKLHRLGLRQVGDFMAMARPALRRRFGPQLLLRLDQALGWEAEAVQPLQPPEPYHERLPCLEPIATRTGIELALDHLLQAVCTRLQAEGKGLRTASLTIHRLDGGQQQVQVCTTQPCHRKGHLLQLFGLQIGQLQPNLGIELFVLEAGGVEAVVANQHSLWEMGSAGYGDALAELLDRIANKQVQATILRHLPAESWWAERSTRPAAKQGEQAAAWPSQRRRPLRLLSPPAPVAVQWQKGRPAAFEYQGQWHELVAAEGPERLEPAWWLARPPAEEAGRDYYAVEDLLGGRYWLFAQHQPPRQCFLHGFFA